jgi:hypothetical protein
MALSKAERLDRKEVSDTAGARAVTLSVMVSSLVAHMPCANLVGLAPDGNALLSLWSFTSPVQGVNGTSSSLSPLVAVPHLLEDHGFGRGSGVDPAHPYAAFLPQVMEGQVAQKYPPCIMIPHNKLMPFHTTHTGYNTNLLDTYRQRHHTHHSSTRWKWIQRL